MQDWGSGIIFGMAVAELIFYAAAAVWAIVMLVFYMKSDKPVKNALIGMLSGAAALLAVHFWGESVGIALPLNGFTVFAALCLGVPGVAAMCVIGFFL